MSHETAPQENYEQKSLFKLPGERPDDVSDEEWNDHLAKRNSGYYARINDWLKSHDLGPAQVSAEEAPGAASTDTEPAVLPLVPAAEAEEISAAADITDEADQPHTAERAPLTWGARVEALGTRISTLSAGADRLQQSKDEKIDMTKRMAKKTSKAALVAGKITLAVPTFVALSPFIATGLAAYGTYRAGKAAVGKTKEVAGAAKDAVTDVYENNAYKVENQARRMRIGLGRAALLRFAPGYLTGQAIAKSAEWTQKRATSRIETNRAKRGNSRTMKAIDNHQRRIDENINRKSRSNPDRQAV